MPNEIKTALDQRAVTKVSSVNEADSVYPRDIRRNTKRQIGPIVPGIRRATIERIFGIREEAFLHRLHFWLEKNCGTSREKIAVGKDGISRQWILNSIESGARGSWQEDLDWSRMTIRRVISRLKLAKVLIVDELNNNRKIRTKWYSIDYNELEKIVKTGFSDQDFKVKFPWVEQYRKNMLASK